MRAFTRSGNDLFHDHDSLSTLGWQLAAISLLPSPQCKGSCFAECVCVTLTTNCCRMCSGDEGEPGVPAKHQLIQSFGKQWPCSSIAGYYIVLQRKPSHVLVCNIFLQSDLQKVLACQLPQLMGSPLPSLDFRCYRNKVTPMRGIHTLGVATGILELMLWVWVPPCKSLTLSIWSSHFFLENVKKEAPFLCYPSLPVTYIAMRFYTCHLVSGHFTVILSLIVTMCAEEEIKTHVVASCQSKAGMLPIH